jgi:Domain of unknown function (DUF4115)
VNEHAEPRPFNEQAALKELERLVDKIQASRRQREAAVAEFDTFVTTFRKERYTELIAQHDAHLAAARRGAAPAAPIAPGAPRVELPPGRVASGATLTREQLVTASPTTFPSRRAALAAAGAVAGILLLVWLWPDRAPRSAARPDSTPAQAPSSPPDPVARTAPPKALVLELTTVREVWVRVIADDRKLLERVIPAGQRVPIGADRAVAIRAGDGGAVRLSLAGKDLGVMGKDGFPANRTLTAPAPAPR